MDIKIPDMNYKFTSNEEPTDEQLAQIMREVGDDAREKTARLKNELYKKIKHEVKEVRKKRSEEQRIKE